MLKRVFTRAAVLASGLVLMLMGTCAAVGGQTTEQLYEETGPQFIAYYFYTSKRCGPCKRIEQWAQEAINEKFSEQIAAGQLQWRAVNVEEPANRHFIKDFQLYSKSVVIAEYRAGKPVRWQNLEKVWQLYRDREKYFDYLARETRSFMEKS